MSKSMRPSLLANNGGHCPPATGGRGAALALLGLLALAGCAGGKLSPEAAAAVAKVCAADAQAQPIAVANAPLVEMVLTMAGQPVPAGGVAAAMAVDQASLHDVVVKACAAVTGAAK